MPMYEDKQTASAYNTNSFEGLYFPYELQLLNLIKKLHHFHYCEPAELGGVWPSHVGHSSVRFRS
jgi:hypothetical protein